jgi:hypothetical protein
MSTLKSLVVKAENSHRRGCGFTLDHDRQNLTPTELERCNREHDRSYFLLSSIPNVFVVLLLNFYSTKNLNF